ncbi:MAG TPA: aminotransferase class V-fold PLP-dependent enzyme [Anaerolineae bacterium]
MPPNDDAEVIYFDNAATSWPKPPQVAQAMVHFLEDVGGSPGRAGHRMSIEASRLVGDAREDLATLFGIDDPCRLAFAKNSTEALNIAIQGLLGPGDHVITSSMEHNSVMRPLRHLEGEGTIAVTVVPCSRAGQLDPDDVRRALRPNTRLVVVLHASNVTGTLLPIREIGAIAQEAGVPFLVDASQTAGAYPIDVKADHIDALAFTGHKSLLGPTGTGGLYLREGLDPPPLLHGGTGSRSEEEYQPDFMPDRYEAGTMNVTGLAGLGASVRFLLDTGVPEIARHERELVAHFVAGAEALPGLTLYGPHPPAERIGVISFSVAGITASKLGLLLDRRYGIMSRIGLHCAPAAHRTIGTFPDGTVRFGFSYFNTAAQVERSLAALAEIIAEEDHERK